MALNPLFLNQCFDKNRLKNLITWSLLTVGERQTIETVENLKALGFQFATQAGVSLSVDDLKIPPEKLSLVSQASQQVEATQQAYQGGNLTAIEKLQQLVDTWHRTSETLKQTVVNHFQSTDKLSPVYMMAFSGARGNISQVRQLAGMRGLMADPQGQIIGFPIRSNFREGLTLTEYMISCYGARKGLVDTALRTADAGYLTRRLVDVSQHMIVKAATCATPRGIVLKDLQSSTKVILPLRERLIGRVLAENVLADNSLPADEKGFYNSSSSGSSGHKTVDVSLDASSGGRGTSSQRLEPGLVGYRNQEISAKLASRIAACRDAVVVRSPLTCSIRHGVCQLCYGWSLSEGRLVTLGEAVGIIAAQSIGEPGTQLTMRTFHTGGVFSGDVMAEIRAPHDGVVDFPQPLQGLLIRTSHGKIAFLTKAPGSLLLKSDQTLAMGKEGTLFALDSLTVLFVRQHEKVARTQLIAEFSSIGREMNETVEAKRILFSEMVGQVSFANVSLGTRHRENGDILQVSRNLGFVWILSGRRSPVTPLLSIYRKGSHLVNQKSLVARVTNKEKWHTNTSTLIANEPRSGGAPLPPLAAVTAARPDFVRLHCLQCTAFEPQVKRCLDLKSTQLRSKERAGDQDSFPFSQNSRFVGLNERYESKIEPNDRSMSRPASLALLRTGGFRTRPVERRTSVKPVNIPNLVGRCSDGTVSARLRFVPNMGYRAISSLRSKENRNCPTERPWGWAPAPSLALLRVRSTGGHRTPVRPTYYFDDWDHPTNIWPRAEEDFKAAKDLSGSQPNMSQGGLHRQPGLATGRRVALSPPSFPDCLLFDSFPLGSPLQNHQERHLSAAALPQTRLLAPFEASSVSRRQGSKAILGQKSHKRLTWTGATSLARLHRSDPIPSTPSFKRGEDQNETVARAPDFYWFPGQQKSGQTGIAWVDSRYIAKRFAHGEIVWINEENLECHAIHVLHASHWFGASWNGPLSKGSSLDGFEGLASQRMHALQAMQPCEAKPTRGQGRALLAMQDPFNETSNPSSGTPNPYEACEAKYVLVKTRTTLQGRRDGSTIETREWSKICSLRSPELSDTSFLAEPCGDLFDQGTICQPLDVKHRLQTVVNLSKEELIKAQGQHFSGIASKERNKLNKTDTIRAELGRQGTIFYKGLINNVQFAFAIRRANPLVSNSAVGSQKSAELEAEFPLEVRGFYKANEKDASWLATKFVTTRSAASLQQETQLATKSTLKVLQIEMRGPGERWPPALHLQVKPGWVYCPYEQTNLPRFHESIQFCGGRGLDNLFFEPALVYLEAFKNKQFLYLTADNLLIATIKVQLLEKGLAAKTMEKRQAETGTNPTSIGLSSLFSHLAPQRISTQMETEEGQSLLSTHPWASHTLVSNLHQTSAEPLKSCLESKPNIWALASQASQGLTGAGGLTRSTKRPWGLALQAMHAPAPSLAGGGHRTPVRQECFVEQVGVLSDGFGVSLNGFESLASQRMHALQAMQPCEARPTRGQEILVLLRKMLWLSQAFAPPLANLNVEASFLRTPLQKRANWKATTYQKQPNARADLYQMLFLRNLLNRESFIWLRAFPVQVQVITNQKARYLGMVSRLYNKICQATSSHIENLPRHNAEKEIELVMALERQPQQGKSQTFVLPNSKLGKYNAQIEKGLLPLVQAEYLLPYGFNFGLNNSRLLDSSKVQIRASQNDARALGIKEQTDIGLTRAEARPVQRNVEPLRGQERSAGLATLRVARRGFVERVQRPPVRNKANEKAAYLHQLVTATWLNTRRIIRAVDPTTPNWNMLQPPGWRTRQAGNPPLALKRRSGSSDSLDRQYGSVYGPQFGKSWFFEPALASRSLLVLIRKGHCYPLSMLEKSKAIFIRRHTLAKISVNKRLPIPLRIGNSLAFYTKQSLTSLILGSPDIRFNVVPLIPFESFQTAFLSNPLYWIRFAGSLSPYFCSNQRRLQGGLNTKEVAGMSSFTSLRIWEERQPAIHTSKDAPQNRVSSPLKGFDGLASQRMHALQTMQPGETRTTRGWPQNFEVAKKVALSLATDEVTAMVSPWAGEMISQWGPLSKSCGEAGDRANYDFSQHPKQQHATSRGSMATRTKSGRAAVTAARGGGENVLFTQADHTSLASEGCHNKTCVGEFVSIGDEVVSGYTTPISGQVVSIEKDKITLRRTQALLFYAQGVMHVKHGEWVEKNAPILTLTYQKLITGDIVQGIPKIEQFFEAPATKEGEPLPNSLQARLRKSFQRLKQIHPVPQAVKRSLEEIQQILVEGILKVYLSQGVRIADKHLEIVIRQMTSKGQVLDVGNTGLFQGEHVRLDRIERINLATYGQKADYEPAVLGITQASLDSESFISAASFQETTRVLSRDTIIGKTDFLRGLKERVVLGDLIQAGTGVDDNINYGLLFGIAPIYNPGRNIGTRAL